MNNKNDLVIDHQALKLCRLDPGRKLTYLIGKNTLVLLPERMTALEAVNTIAVLTSFTTDLMEIIQNACGSCEEQMEQEEGCCPFGGVCGPDECPYADMDGPEVELSDSARRELGIPLDAKLQLLPNVGEGLVCAADYKHDITDVPESILPLLAMSGICPGKLDELIMDEEEVWHG